MMGTDPAILARLEVDLSAIAANWRALAVRHPSGPVAGVVKADAYGLGAVRVAPALHEAGCRHFFTAHLGEAIAIRPTVPGGLLAVLNGLPPGSEADFVAHGVVPVLGTLGEIERWRALARLLGRRLLALLHLDTGMSRLGVQAARPLSRSISRGAPPASRPSSTASPEPAPSPSRALKTNMWVTQTSKPVRRCVTANNSARN